MINVIYKYIKFLKCIFFHRHLLFSHNRHHIKSLTTIHPLIIFLSLTLIFSNVFVSPSALSAGFNPSRISRIFVRWLSQNPPSGDLAHQSIDEVAGKLYNAKSMGRLNRFADQFENFVDPTNPSVRESLSVNLSVIDMQNGFNHSFRQVGQGVEGFFLPSVTPNLPAEILIKGRLLSKLPVHGTFQWLDNHLTRLSDELALLRRPNKPVMETAFFVRAVSHDLRGILNQMESLNRAIGRMRGPQPDLSLLIQKWWGILRQVETLPLPSSRSRIYPKTIHSKIRDNFQKLVTKLCERIEGYNVGIVEMGGDIQQASRRAIDQASRRATDQRLLAAFERAAVEGRDLQFTEIMMRARDNVDQVSIDELLERRVQIDDLSHESTRPRSRSYQMDQRDPWVESLDEWGGRMDDSDDLGNGGEGEWY